MKDEALKMALEALDSKYILGCGEWRGQQLKAITAIKEALAQPAQEPVGSLNITSYKGLGNYDFDYVGQLPDGTYSVYTTPPAAPQKGGATCKE